MTSVLRNRYVLQPLLLLACGVTIAWLSGCSPDAGKAGTSGEPAADLVAAGAPGEKAAAKSTPARKEDAENAPAEKEEAKTDPPVEDTVDVADDGKIDPTDDNIMKWFPEAVPLPEAEAQDQQGMKAYAELIPGADVTIEMVPIPGGKFLMGSPDEEKKRKDDEGPRHEVQIEPFWMGKYELTWEQYELYGLSLDKHRRDRQHETDRTKPSQREELVDAVARPTNPYSDMSFGMGKRKYPAICMTQLAAQGFCRWLSARTGRYYRLPTEAEWEYACRAGQQTAYSFGDDPAELDDYGWYFDNSDGQYQKIGTKKPNSWGLYDMHGNVSEWVADQHVADFYKQFAGKTTGGPLAVPKTEYPRVARGGCWDDDPDMLRSAARRASSEDWKADDPQFPKSIWYFTNSNCPGFRVVRPLKVPSAEEAQAFEWDAKRIREYQEAQAGKE